MVEYLYEMNKQEGIIMTLRKSTDFVLRPNTLLPDLSEHHEVFLVNHPKYGYLMCDAIFDEDGQFHHFFCEGPNVYTSVPHSDCRYYVRLPSTTDAELIHLNYEGFGSVL